MSFTPSTEPLQTARLRLEPLRIAHAQEMTAVLADEALYLFTGGQPPTAEALNRRYTMLCAGSRSDTEQWHNWIVYRLESGQAVGTVQATVTGTSTDLAWTIGVASQGQGYAQEAAAAIRDWLAAHGVRWVSAWIKPDHFASERIAQSLGMATTDKFDEDGEFFWLGEATPNDRS